MVGWIERLGDKFLYFLEDVGRAGIFLFYSIVGILKPPFKIHAILKQIHFIGVSSIFVIFFTAGFTGMVLGLQGYHTLRQFGSEGLLGSAVALSLIRELGPVLTALMVTGRAGSAICAEVGIMRISQQIDALECMGIDPFRFILAPKYVAALISLPLLVFFFDVVGIFGGYLVGVQLLGINPGAYFDSMQRSVVFKDINMGLIKSIFFALQIVWICAYTGYTVDLERRPAFGAEGVSRATTNAVVLSSVLILLWDYLLTAVLL